MNHTYDLNTGRMVPPAHGGHRCPRCSTVYLVAQECSWCPGVPTQPYAPPTCPPCHHDCHEGADCPARQPRSEILQP